MIAHRNLRALIALALLPALLAAMALWSLGDRVADTDRIAAAVVNLDEPVTTGAGDHQQTVAAGRLLAAGLTSPHEDAADAVGQRLDWQLTDAVDARAGRDAGTYDAVVTIPEDFSQTVAGLARNEAQRASFTVRSADGSGALLGLLTDDVSRIAGAELGHRITGTYLEGLYGQTAQLGVRLGRAADAATRIGDGAGRLTTGADTLADGAGDLGDGVGALATGADTVRQGSERASAGAGALTTGLGRLSGGAEELSSAAGRLARGAGDLGEGASRLGDGADRLASGATELSTGLAALDRGVQPLPTQAGSLADGAAAVSQGVAGWARVLGGWQQACAADPTLARYATLCAGTTQAVGTDGSTADQLVAGSTAVASGARELAAAAPALAQGVSDAADGAERLHAGAARLATGADRLATGVGRLVDGAGQIGAGAGRLADGAGSASTGAARLAAGTSEIAGGAGQLAEGATRAADGAGSVASGADRLASGAGRVSEGSAELADGLREGVEALPSMTATEQQELAQAVAAPVAVHSDVDGPTDATRLGIAPAVLATLMWLGAALIYLLRPALPPVRLQQPGLPWRVALAGWTPALLCSVAQALLLVPVLAAFDVSTAHLGVLLAGLVLAGAAFAALVQGIVALLGPARGKATVLVLLAVQALLLNGLLPIDAAPDLVQRLRGLLPVPAAADLVHAGVTGHGTILSAVLLLLTWTVVGLVMATRAARRAAVVTPSDLQALGEDGADARGEVLAAR